MKNLFFLVLCLVLLVACNNEQKQINVTATELSGVETSQIDNENHILSFNIVIKNNEAFEITTNAMGVEVFANGLKIGENYCKLSSTLLKNSSQNIPVSIVFKVSDLGVSDQRLPKEIRLNIQGQLKVIMNESEQRIPIKLEGLSHTEN